MFKPNLASVSLITGAAIAAFAALASTTKRKPQGKWPLKPKTHSDDRHFLLNEYDTYGIMQFVSKRVDAQGAPIGIDMWTVCLLENGYGQRYCNILKNGVIINDSSLVRSSEEWKKQIEPWLTNQTDFIPLQDGVMNAKIALSVHEFKKEIDKFNNK